MDLSQIQKNYYEDPLLVVDKKPGISVTKNQNSEICLADIVKTVYGDDWSPVHRLDTNTSGLMIFAYGDMLSSLNQLMRDRQITKCYLGVVEGEIPYGEHGIIDKRLRVDTEHNHTFVDPEGKGAVTEYYSLGTDGEASLMMLYLRTGKSHQIRAHMGYLNCPIKGDIKYGSISTEGQYLHSCMLGFLTLSFLSIPPWFQKYSFGRNIEELKSTAEYAFRINLNSQFTATFINTG